RPPRLARRARPGREPRPAPARPRAPAASAPPAARAAATRPPAAPAAAAEAEPRTRRHAGGPNPTAVPAPSPSLVLSLLAVASVPALAGLPVHQPATACLTDGTVHDLLLVDGVVYLAGAFSHVRPPGAAIGDPGEVERLWFAACDAATGAVLAWNPQATCDGTLYTTCNNSPRGQTLALSADRQSIYLGGKFRAVGGAERRHAARVSRANAAVDATWLPEPNDRVQRILAAPDGSRVYVAGNFTQ